MKLTTIWTLLPWSNMGLKERLSRTGEWALREMAHWMPRRLAYWSFIDTGGRYTQKDIVPEVTYMTVLERFGKDIEKV